MRTIKELNLPTTHSSQQLLEQLFVIIKQGTAQQVQNFLAQNQQINITELIGGDNIVSYLFHNRNIAERQNKIRILVDFVISKKQLYELLMVTPTDPKFDDADVNVELDLAGSYPIMPVAWSMCAFQGDDYLVLSANSFEDQEFRRLMVLLSPKQRIKILSATHANNSQNHDSQYPLALHYHGNLDADNCWQPLMSLTEGFEQLMPQEILEFFKLSNEDGTLGLHIANDACKSKNYSSFVRLTIHFPRLPALERYRFLILKYQDYDSRLILDLDSVNIDRLTKGFENNLHPLLIAELLNSVCVHHLDEHSGQSAAWKILKERRLDIILRLTKNFHQLAPKMIFKFLNTKATHKESEDVGISVAWWLIYLGLPELFFQLASTLTTAQLFEILQAAPQCKSHPLFNKSLFELIMTNYNGYDMRDNLLKLMNAFNPEQLSDLAKTLVDISKFSLNVQRSIVLLFFNNFAYDELVDFMHTQRNRFNLKSLLLYKPCENGDGQALINLISAVNLSVLLKIIQDLTNDELMLLLQEFSEDDIEGDSIKCVILQKEKTSIATQIEHLSQNDTINLHEINQKIENLLQSVIQLNPDIEYVKKTLKDFIALSKYFRTRLIIMMDEMQKQNTSSGPSTIETSFISSSATPYSAIAATHIPANSPLLLPAAAETKSANLTAAPFGFFVIGGSPDVTAAIPEKVKENRDPTTPKKSPLNADTTSLDKTKNASFRELHRSSDSDSPRLYPRGVAPKNADSEYKKRTARILDFGQDSDPDSPKLMTRGSVPKDANSEYKRSRTTVPQ